MNKPVFDESKIGEFWEFARLKLRGLGAIHTFMESLVSKSETDMQSHIQTHINALKNLEATALNILENEEPSVEGAVRVFTIVKQLMEIAGEAKVEIDARLNGALIAHDILTRNKP